MKMKVHLGSVVVVALEANQLPAVPAALKQIVLP